jgi:predicted nucleic acid-binding protein
MFTKGFMLDTCAINRIHDGLDCEWSLRGPLYVTDIQLQEIAQTRDRGRRESLMQAFFSLRPTVIRPQGLIFDADFFGFSTYCVEGPFLSAEDYARPIGRIMPFIAAALGSRIERQFRDALIGEAALRNSLTLVTSDRKLGKVASSFGARVEVIQ